MSETTKKMILQKAEELKIRFVRLKFTDIMGIPKNIEVPIRDLEKVLDGNIMFDGSSVQGFCRIEESDMYLQPDLDTFMVNPWEEEQYVARIICDIVNPDKTPFAGCARTNLKRVLADLKKMGYTANFGPEMEFYIFGRDEQNKPTTKTNDQASYFDLSPIDLGEELRRDMAITLEKLGFEVEASHHEVGPGQHEIDFRYSDGITTADRIMVLKLTSKTIAMWHNLHVTFMPKPVYGIAGSGMHTNISLFKNGKNAFYDPDIKYDLSKEALYFIGGIMKHAKGLAAITNPLVNSYKRLISGYEAPVYIAWSHRNRSPLIRIPVVRDGNTRIEFRCPDPSCNPYLTFAVILTAGIDGIQKKIMPPDPINENIYAMDDQKLKKYGIECLPTNLKEALEEFQKDKVLHQGLTDHIITNYLRAKYKEWELYSLQVSPWELEQYLANY
ncbi:MAG: type I glutamate--ammonia ligase [Atribacterota bacterium]|nr:type I glutamate--ammonia ligase [Atribacterota bacterium]MDD4895226.1 type I glutamate--ammonia ligase [Atribacterota bacterium]MDD5637012.1 type I glutamate--ammonia ligase [Atribacterota bacterium]